MFAFGARKEHAQQEPAMTLLERLPSFHEGLTPALETARLRLRAPGRADIEAIARLATDRRIAENTARIPHPYTLADAESYIRYVEESESETAFAVTLADDVLIGICSLRNEPRKVPEIGYWLGAPYWGHGYATEAARALIDHAFGDLGLEQLEAGARVSNPASRRVLEKCGFQWTGVSLKRIHAIASSAPVDRFRLDRRLWASLKAWGQAGGQIARAPRRVA
jgi:RimJ/RimL family protein N-acetyltransferase